MTLPALDNHRARRLFLDRHLLLRPASGSGKGDDLNGVLAGLGFVQVDSVNTLARAHDLILWSRRTTYRPQALRQLVARHRSAFEHWTYDAAVIPMRFYSMWRLKFARDEARMRARWPAARRDGWEAEIATVLRHITDRADVRAGAGQSFGRRRLRPACPGLAARVTLLADPVGRG